MSSDIQEILSVIPVDAPELTTKKQRKPRAQGLKDTQEELKEAGKGLKEKKLRKPRTVKAVDDKENKEVKTTKKRKSNVGEKEIDKQNEQKKEQKKEKPEEEVGECPICIEKYTPILRKKCVCKYCNSDTCSKCIERYLLETIQDAHCLHCKVNYNDATLRDICTMTYLQQTYFKHRQDILTNREKANLPGLQDLALDEKKKRENKIKIAILTNEMNDLISAKNKKDEEFTILYSKILNTHNENEKSKLRENIQLINKEISIINENIIDKKLSINTVHHIMRYTNTTGEVSEPEEKKKFIRRCTRDNCQGFLSTSWKCGICEYYSCNKCFKVKGQKPDDAHECNKDDIETADLIKKDSKPCPKCGEFITKSSGCSMMFCISCKTPWDWNTGKIVTHGMIHNPHYYEWLRRNGEGGQMQRNPLDVPCGGYPNGWELRKLPKSIKRDINDMFYEFHRICLEIQDISAHTYRSHLDNTVLSDINVKFLLNDYDEKHWGQLLAKNEKKRKRDSEVQEIFAAFRMVAVELINRIHNYTFTDKDGKICNITGLDNKKIEEIIVEWDKEVQTLIEMINNALQQVSICYHYIVPNIEKDKPITNYRGNKFYYKLVHKNYYDELKKTKSKSKEDNDNMSNNIITKNNVEHPTSLPVLSSELNKHENIVAMTGVAMAGTGVSSNDDTDTVSIYEKEDLENLLIIARFEEDTEYADFLEDELKLYD